MKILVADDSAILRTAVRRLLEPEGYEVIEAADGVEAITRIFEQPPALVLLDVTMPRLTGYVVCRLIKEDPLLSGIPVLILTARDSAEDRYWAERSGADGYLTKDALGDGLVGAINSALASHALLQIAGMETAPPPAVIGEADVLTRVCELLDRKLFEATIVAELAAVGGQAMRIDEMLVSVFEMLGRIVTFDVAAIGLVPTEQIYAVARRPVSPVDAEDVREFAMRQLVSVAGFDRDQVADILWFDDPTIGAISERKGWGSWYGAGLHHRGQVVGILVLASRAAGTFPASVARTLRTVERALAGVVGAAVDYAHALSAGTQEDEDPWELHGSFRLTSM